MNLLTKTTFTLAALSLSACASVSGMQSSDMSNANTRVFSASKATTTQAALNTLSSLDYTVQQTKEAEKTTEIYFSIPISAFSWGEVARMDVTGLDANTTSVAVAIHHKDKIQLTGTGQKTYADRIFNRMQTGLTK